MAEVILRGGDLDNLAEVLGGELAILDADGHRPAAVGDIGSVGRRRLGGQHQRRDPDQQQAADTAGAGRGLGRATRHGEHWVLAAGAGSEALCTLVPHAPGELSETDTRILARCCSSGAAWRRPRGGSAASCWRTC